MTGIGNTHVSRAPGIRRRAAATAGASRRVAGHGPHPSGALGHPVGEDRAPSHLWPCSSSTKRRRGLLAEARSLARSTSICPPIRCVRNSRIACCSTSISSPRHIPLCCPTDRGRAGRGHDLAHRQAVGNNGSRRAPGRTGTPFGSGTNWVRPTSIPAKVPHSSRTRPGRSSQRRRSDAWQRDGSADLVTTVRRRLDFQLACGSPAFEPALGGFDGSPRTDVRAFLSDARSDARTGLAWVPDPQPLAAWDEVERKWRQR